MRNRKIKLVATISGFDTEIATIKIQNYAQEKAVSDWTELVCPICGEKTQYMGGYHCQKDNVDFNHWSKLKRVIKGTTQPLETPRLIAEKEIPKAQLTYLTKAEFAQQYTDATRKDEGEKGILLVDNTDDKVKLLFKLLVAVEELNYVVVAKWNDTTEQIVGILTMSASGRILIREIIPSNLLIQKETLTLDRTKITQQEVEEAKAFVKAFIPKASAETFTVNDYRVGIEGIAQEPQTPQKALDIKEILAQHNINVNGQQMVEVVPKTKPLRRKK